jgi:hypothetical protein
MGAYLHAPQSARGGGVVVRGEQRPEPGHGSAGGGGLEGLEVVGDGGAEHGGEVEDLKSK